MMTGKSGKKRIYLAGLCLALAVLAGLALYNAAMSRAIDNAACQTMGELMTQQKLTFNSHMKGEMAVADTIASLLAQRLPEMQTPETALPILQDAAQNSRFQQVALAWPSGKALSSEGVELDMADTSYFQCAKSGTTCISDPVISKVDGQTIVNFAAPVKVAGRVEAVFVGSYITSNLGQLFFPAYNGEGHAYICDSSGEIITGAGGIVENNRTNLLAELQSAQSARYDNYSTIVSRIEGRESGHAIYSVNGEKILLHYAPLGINGWYIFLEILQAVVASQGNYLMVLTVVLTIVICLLFSGLVAYLFYSHRRYSRLLYQKAYYNDLTKSPSLLKFREDATELLGAAPARPYAAVRTSIENLDFLNEIFSYATGDKLIQAVARAYSEILRPGEECFGHIYGDRFVALLSCRSFEELEARMAVFEEAFERHSAGLVSYKVKFAVGLYLAEDGETDIGTILEKVNFAHQTAKDNNRLEDKTQRYNSELKKALTLEREVEARMEHALAAGEFTMFLQGKYRLADNQLVGAEALARWWVNNEYILYPLDFIPIFEKNGFVTRLDMYMFEQACLFIRRLLDDGKKPLVLSTNFSRLHLLKGGFVARLCTLADQHLVPHEYLEVEITESSMVGNEAVLKSVLEELHEAGFTLSMDDFGTGYSSLGLLKEIPLDVIKIDRSFLENSHGLERDRIVIESVIEMAKKLNIHTVAEGVENPEQIELLRQLDCEVAQGFYYSKPVPFSEFYETLY